MPGRGVGTASAHPPFPQEATDPEFARAGEGLRSAKANPRCRRLPKARASRGKPPGSAGAQARLVVPGTALSLPSLRFSPLFAGDSPLLFRLAHPWAVIPLSSCASALSSFSSPLSSFGSALSSSGLPFLRLVLPSLRSVFPSFRSALPYLGRKRMKRGESPPKEGGEEKQRDNLAK